MTTTVKVTYTAQGSPNTNMTFDLTGIDIESIKQQLPLKMWGPKKVQFLVAVIK
jgi:hypothetical protein